MAYCFFWAMTMRWNKRPITHVIYLDGKALHFWRSFFTFYSIFTLWVALTTEIWHQWRIVAKVQAPRNEFEICPRKPHTFCRNYSVIFLLYSVFALWIALIISYRDIMWHHWRFVSLINYIQTVLTKCNSVVDRNNNFFDFSVRKPYQRIRASHY